MGTTYKATVTVRCWKEHTCLGCGKIYRYQFTRTKSAEGGTEYAAEQAVHQVVMKALEHEVDMQPCPGCGLHQPDMIGKQRSTRHWWVTGITAAVLAVLFILAMTKVVGAGPLSLVMVGVGAVSLLAHFFIYRSNPNRDLEANQKEGQYAVERGLMEIGPPAANAGASEAPSLGSSLAMVLLLLMALASLGMAAAEGLRTVSGWTYNMGWYPPVAGPGDTILMYFPQGFSSIKGYWKGVATVEILNAAEVGYNGPAFRAATHQAGWGSSISVKSSEKNSSVTPWAYVEIPNNPALVGKQLRLKIDLTVEFPVISGGRSFDEAVRNLSHIQEVKLSTANAGASYNQVWWWGTVGGSIALLVLGFGMTRVAAALTATAPPTNVVPCE